MRIVLASGSPRRADILAKAGFKIQIFPPGIDEARLPDEDPESYVKRAAALKAESVFASLDQPGSAEHLAPVLGADTIVACGSAVIGKPESRGEAKKMLRALSGKSHRVFTGIAVKTHRLLLTGAVSTLVSFREFSDRMIDAYAETGEPMDKAGAYAIQGEFGPVLIDRVEGSYSNVVGLPLKEAVELLRQAAKAG